MTGICSHGGPQLPAAPSDLVPALFDVVQTSGKFLEEVQRFSAGAAGCMDVLGALGGEKRLALCV